MKRRIFGMLLVLAMVLSMALGVSAAETGTDDTSALILEVTQSKTSAVVEVYLQGCDGVTNGRFSVDYDADVLTLAQVTVSDAYAMSSVNDETAGTVSLAWVGSDLTDEKTLMLTLTLEAAEQIADSLTYTAQAEGIYADTDAVEVAGDLVTVAYDAVDTTALEQAIAAAEALNAAEYTEESYAAVESALTEALVVLADDGATQEEVDAATLKLTEAMAELVKLGELDYSQLEKAIDAASKLDKADYTEESFADLQDALKDAKAVLESEDVTQAQIDAATKALKDAMDALESPKTGDESNIFAWLGLLTVSAVAIAVLVVLLRSGKHKQVCRFFALVLVAAMTMTMLPANVFAVDMDLTGAIKDTLGNVVGTVQQIVNPDVNLKLDQDLTIKGPYKENDLVRIIVELEGKSLLERGYTQNQIAANGASVSGDAQKLVKLQDAVTEQIAAIVENSGLLSADAAQTEAKYNYTVALNGIAMTVPYGTLEQIRQLDGVVGAYVASQYEAAVTDTSYEPNMYATSDGFGSAQTWNELGYTGQGMKIAIIDSGLDVDHPSFADAPEGASLDLEGIENVLTDLNAYYLYSQKSAVALTADKLYYSEKVPYGFNYVDGGLDVTHDYDGQGDHGTHVAGIAAANKIDSSSVVGVAPDAQILVMKVFGVNGGAYSDDIMAAIEDCILLGVDVINMSLGSPAGYTEDSVLINEVYGRILQTDMILAVAAGNTNSSATGNSLGTNLNYTSDPDNGLVNSPATYLASTTVASMENTSMMMPYFTVGEHKMAYVDVTYFNFAALAGTYEYVVIPGLGENSDYDGLDVTGKVALVQRGTIDFTTKQENAYKNGAVALVVYDNVEGDLISMYDGGFLPNVFISKADGEKMIAAAVDGVGTMQIMPYGVETPVPNSTAGQLSDFSCWGVTPDLQLSPDVTAPGGMIYSCLMDGAYGTMSGTSMASPHIAGMSALVLQYLHENYPDMTDEQYHAAAESLLMCTAVPIYDPDGILYSPRKQGAGSANVYSAVTSPVYLTSLQAATGELTPKASMGDDPDRTGVFTFTFDMNNLTGEDQVYILEGVALTDQYVQIDGKEYMGETGKNLSSEILFEILNTALLPQYDADQDGDTDMDDVQYLLDTVNGLKTLSSSLSEQMDISGDGVLNTVDAQLLYLMLMEGFEQEQLVVVPANSSLTVNVTVKLSAEDMAYMEEHYENGIYVDGFVRAYAQSEGAVDLSLPFVGFYGDWHDAPMFDTGWYYEDEETVEYNRYLHVIFATLGADGNYAGLGINPYILEEYDPEHNVLSPNGDTYYDYVPDIYISMMRSAELLDFTWTDDATGEQLFYEYYAYARKSYYWSAYGMSMPIVYSDGGLAPFTFYDENGALMVEDLQHLTLTIRGYLDDGDLDGVAVDDKGNPLPDTAWADAEMQIPVVIDLAKPKLNLSSVVYSTENGRNYITFDVEDNYDIAAVVAMTNGGDAYEYIPVNEKEKGVDGEKATIKLDITGYDSSFQLVLCDYGCNESYYQLTNEFGAELSEDEFYAFRRYSSPIYGDSMYSTDELNGWYSFENADDMIMHTSQANSGEATVYAAEYIDGYIIGAQEGDSSSNGANTLFVMKEGSWERTALGGSFAMRKTYYQWPGRTETYFPLNLIALDMAYDYSTDTLYMLANALENNYFPEGVEDLLLKVDYMTGNITLLGMIEPADGEEFLALTLACDNDGTLYTVNYENGQLYTIDVEGAKSAYGDDVTNIKNPMNIYTATSVDADGKVSYYPAAYTQSMTIDHETGKLYWAAYQSKVGTAYFFEVDKTNGELISMTLTEDNSEMTGLFKPYDSGKDIIPEAELAGITLNASNLYLSVGQTATLLASANPFNAQLGEIEWSSADESIAEVTPYGVIEAVGVGVTTITATCGEFTAKCTVNVSNATGTVYAFSGDSWLLMDASQPFNAMQVADAMVLDGEVKAAAYLQGYIYAAAVDNGVTNLYKLDPSTLSGVLIGSSDVTVTALAMNYADGFMYGLAQGADESSYDLVRVNLNTGDMVTVSNLNAIFDPEDWEVCSGALAIDYDGNFYVNGEVVSGRRALNALIRFNLDQNGQLANITSYTGLSDDVDSGDAMIWSERNGGIIRSYRDPDTYEYVLSWIDVSDMENVVEISLGSIRGSAYPGVFALAMPISQEPGLPSVLPTSITLEESYTVPTGETITVIPATQPWNANAPFAFEIADTSIATVDENGVVTGVSIGETTLTVTVPGTDVSATATIVVEKNPGYLYGFFQADLAQSIPLEYWGRIPVANTADSTILTDQYDFTIYAASYYDGFVYACGQSGLDGLYYFLKISPSNYAYEVLSVSKVMVRDMAFDYTTGAMYVVAYDEMINGGLYQLDLKTGELTLVGDNDMGAMLVALACDDEGVLYAADSYGEVFVVNKNTVELTTTGISGGYSQYLQSMVYDYNNDTIYWAKGGVIYRVDVENGQLSGIGRADIDSGEMVSSGCIVSGLFSVPLMQIEVPETVKPSGVVLDEKNTVAVGDQITIDAVVLPESVFTVDQTLTWSSDDESIATVDENGVVTGVSAGTVYINATDAEGNTDSILITVTAEQRYLYGYDEISHSWMRFDFNGNVVSTWADAEGMSPIVAAQYIGDVLYAYDQDGYFYTVDTETFQRTKLGDGIHGMVVDLEAWDSVNGIYYAEDCPYRVIDMTYTETQSGYVAYAAIMAHNVSEWQDSFDYQIVEIDLTTGAIARAIVDNSLVDYEMSLRPSNLIYRNGYLYTVNGYITGMVTKIDPEVGTVTGTAIFAEYWGDFNGARSLIEDPLTGEVYAIRDKRTQYIGELNYDDTKSESILFSVSLGVAHAEKICELGIGLRITGMFIK